VDLHQVDGRRAVRRRCDRVPVAERFADRVAEGIVVVDDEDAGPRDTVAVRPQDLPQRDLALPLVADGPTAVAGADAPGERLPASRGVNRIASAIGSPSLGSH
jgi:hypothetical protein